MKLNFFQIFLIFFTTATDLNATTPVREAADKFCSEVRGLCHNLTCRLTSPSGISILADAIKTLEKNSKDIIKGLEDLHNPVQDSEGEQILAEKRQIENRLAEIVGTDTEIRNKIEKTLNNIRPLKDKLDEVKKLLEEFLATPPDSYVRLRLFNEELLVNAEKELMKQIAAYNVDLTELKASDLSNSRKLNDAESELVAKTDQLRKRQNVFQQRNKREIGMDAELERKIKNVSLAIARLSSLKELALLSEQRIQTGKDLFKFLESEQGSKARQTYLTFDRLIDLTAASKLPIVVHINLGGVTYRHLSRVELRFGVDNPAATVFAGSNQTATPVQFYPRLNFVPGGVRTASLWVTDTTGGYDITITESTPITITVDENQLLSLNNF